MDNTPTQRGLFRPVKTPMITPNRRAISAEPPSTRRSIHTPLDRSAPRDLLNSIRRTPGSVFKNAPTPHAKAARRALNQRRNAMFTPGKNRRRSLRELRETPMGILRNLGKALAPHSKPILSSSSSPDVRLTPKMMSILEDDDDDELPIDKPRLSLPLDEVDEDESDLQPPRSSGLEEDNYTVQSIELPRRAVSEQPSRMSIGSDFHLNDPTLDMGRQSDFFPGLLEDIQAQEAADFSFGRIDVEPPRRLTIGRESDFGLEMPAGLDDQTTFMMSEPSANVDTTSPVIERSVVEAVGNEARDGDEPDVYSSDDNGGFPDFGGAGSDDDVEVDDADDDDANDANDVEGTDQVNLESQPDMTDALDDMEDMEEQGHEVGVKKKRKKNRISKHGIQFPPLPPAFIKKVAQTALQTSGLSNQRISADTLAALTQASEWFFEQMGDDLGAYAGHAKRKTIEESDVIMLMRRQRQVSGDSTLFSLAQRHLPRELLQELRMPVPQPAKQRRNKKANADDTQDITEEIT